MRSNRGRLRVLIQELWDISLACVGLKLVCHVCSLHSIASEEYVVMFESIRSPLQRLEDKIAQARAPWDTALVHAPRLTDDPLAQLQEWVASSALTHVLTAHQLAPLPDALRAWMRPAPGRARGSRLGARRVRPAGASARLDRARCI